MREEVSEFVDVRGVNVRERRIEYIDPESGEAHVAILVEDEKGDTLFAPEFLSHTNDFVKVDVTLALPGQPARFFEVVDYNVKAHAMIGRRIPHPGAESPLIDEEVESEP